MPKANKGSYELAVELFKQHIKDGWNIEAAASDACCSFRLNLVEQTKIFNKADRLTKKGTGKR